MICNVYKRKRKKNGKTVTDRNYRGRYRLDGDYAITDVALGTSDKQVAEKKLREIIKEKEMERSGILAPKLQREAAMKKLSAHLDDFIADLKVKGRAEKYYSLVETRVEKLLNACGWREVRDVNADGFVAWRSGQKLSPKTLNEYLNAMNTFFSWMVKQERVMDNPLRNIEKLDLRGRQQKRRAISDEEFSDLLEVAGKHRLLYITAVYTGLRLGELRSLKWFNIQLGAEMPKIVVPEVSTKNRREAVIPLHPELVNLLIESSKGVDMTTHVFPQEYNPDRTFRRHLREAGIEKVDGSGKKLDFHSLRYTFATKLAKSGVSQRLTQELMRHSDPRLTANLYTDVNQLPTFEAVKGLGWTPENNWRSDEGTQIGTQIGTQKLDSESLLVAQVVTENSVEGCAQTLVNKGIIHVLARTVTNKKKIPTAGLEPAHPKADDFESSASTNSATSA